MSNMIDQARVQMEHFMMCGHVMYHVMVCQNVNSFSELPVVEILIIYTPAEILIRKPVDLSEMF